MLVFSVIQRFTFIYDYVNVNIILCVIFSRTGLQNVSYLSDYMYGQKPSGVSIVLCSTINQRNGLDCWPRDPNTDNRDLIERSYVINSIYSVTCTEVNIDKFLIDVFRPYFKLFHKYSHIDKEVLLLSYSLL